MTPLADFRRALAPSMPPAAPTSPRGPADLDAASWDAWLEAGVPAREADELDAAGDALGARRRVSAAHARRRVELRQLSDRWRELRGES